MENLWHCWSNNLRKNEFTKLCNRELTATQFIQFFLKLLDQQCHKFSKSYQINFSTDLSFQILDWCPRNFEIQEEGFGNVVSTSHWITPVITHLVWHSIHVWEEEGLYAQKKFLSLIWKSMSHTLHQSVFLSYVVLKFGSGM